MMLKKCAWCCKDIGHYPCDPADDGKVIYGICGDCGDKMLVEDSSVYDQKCERLESAIAVVVCFILLAVIAAVVVLAHR
jgi:hypothetical protein